MARWKPSTTEGFIRRVKIVRVRNHDDDSQWVDIAVTTGMVLKRKRADRGKYLNNERGASRHAHHYSKTKFMRFVWTFEFLQIGRPNDVSDHYEVKSAAELQALADEFAAAHPD